MARTGRPRAFDRNQALDSAMRLFWQHGYEVTSLDQLKRAMGGISPASFYAAFGSKAALFREVIAYYDATHGRVTSPLYDTALPPREAIEQCLRRSAAMQTDTSHPSGCLIALSAVAWSQQGEPVQAEVGAKRRANRDAIRSCIQRAVISNELKPDVDVAGLTSLFDGLLLGLSIQARDGVTVQDLQAAITAALLVWDQCLNR